MNRSKWKVRKLRGKEREREKQSKLFFWRAVNPDLYSSWGARGIEWCAGKLLLARSPLLPEETRNAVFLQTFPGGDGSRSQAPSSSKEKGTGCGSSNLRDNKNQNPRHLEQHRPKTLFHIQWLTQLNRSLKRVLELHPSCPIASSFGFLSTRDALSKRGGLDGFKTCPHLLFQLHKAPQVCGGWNGQSWWRAILHRPRALPGQRQSVQRMARSGARWAGQARGRVASAPTSKTRVGAVCTSTEGSRLTVAEPSTRTPVPLWRLLPPKGGLEHIQLNWEAVRMGRGAWLLHILTYATVPDACAFAFAFPLSAFGDWLLGLSFHNLGEKSVHSFSRMANLRKERRVPVLQCRLGLLENEEVLKCVFGLLGITVSTFLLKRSNHLSVHL